MLVWLVFRPVAQVGNNNCWLAHILTHRVGRQFQRFVVSELAVLGGVLGWLVFGSVTQVAHDDRLFAPLLKT